MGMLDNLFGGNEDREREEMRENIDKIRDKVQGGREGAPAPEQDEDLQPPLPPGQLDESSQEEQAGTPPEGRVPEDQPYRDDDPGERPQETPPDTGSGGQQPAGRGREPEPPETGATAGTGGGSTTGPTHEDVPEPPELKDLDVPDIEKGPLFITVDKFREALEAITDLRRIADDMDSYIGSMEGTLQEDRDTEAGIRDVLDEADSDTEELKGILSP
ncbi:MAG: hypothetical protein SVW77_02010 [Candidatus Nanohaloarchaea archaeon]|nr:hypothetical protein [Candidatus Nanohaloarchaea archaeon]